MRRDGGRRAEDGLLTHGPRDHWAEAGRSFLTQRPSAAKPQPKPELTTDRRYATDKGNPSNPRLKILAACEQLGLLQCREARHLRPKKSCQKCAILGYSTAKVQRRSREQEGLTAELASRARHETDAPSLAFASRRVVGEYAEKRLPLRRIRPRSPFPGSARVVAPPHVTNLTARQSRPGDPVLSL